MKISLLLTGNELMTGDTIDSNSAYLAQSLKDLTLVPYIKKVVGDDLHLLISSIKELAAVSDVLIVNGGLGPTVDDLTAQALGLAIDSPLQQNAQAMEKLEAWAERRGFVITKSNLKQTELPAVCEVIDNPYGSAMGFRCVHQGCLIMCTPGVPSEFKPMVEAYLLPLIRAHGQLDVISEITRIRLFGITESGLQDTVDTEFPDWPAEVELGFRVQMPVIEVKLATVGEQLRDLNALWTEKFSARFSDYIIGRDSTRLTEALNTALLDQGLTLTTAESCTGGLIAAGITSEAGASRVFEAGYVVYSNEIKQRTLGVSATSLSTFGAVSEAVVREMADGALDKSGADLALAISGVAGPDGGTEEKPVGTVWMAWGRKGSISARRFFFPVPRIAFQKTAAAIAMDLVRRDVLGLPTDVDYFSELKKKRN